MDEEEDNTIRVSSSRKKYAMSFITSLENEWKNNSFCDVSLTAKKDGLRIKAHRLILAATNSHFKELLSSKSMDQDIEIEDITGEELQTFINYSYTGKIEINTWNVRQLLVKSSSLNYSSIFKKCEDFIIENLHPADCFESESFAQKHNCQRLTEAIKSYQKEQFVDIIQFEEYLDLSPDKAYEFFSNRNIKDAKLEKKAFRAAMWWTKHDQPNREKFLPKLLSSLKLNFIEDAFLERAIKAVSKNEECTRIVKEAIDNKIVVTGNKLVITYEDISIYCLDKKSVEKKIEIHPLYASSSTVLIKDKIFAVGEGEQLEHSFWSINIKNEDFADLRPTLKPRDHCSVVEFNGDIYAIGGFDDKSVNTAEKFDAKVNRWKPIKNLIKGTIGHASAVLQEKIFVVGGRNLSDHSVTNTVQSFNPKTNSWSLHKPMLQERDFFTMVAKDNCLFIIGGRNKNSEFVKTIEKYDSEKDLWTESAQLTNKYEEVAACLVENKIIIVGGCKGNVKLVMEEFNPETDECKLIGNLPIKNNFQGNLFVHFYKKE